MQPNENNDTNMNTLNSPADNGAPTGLSSVDNSANTNQQPTTNQPMGQQSDDSKKTKRGLVIACLIISILLIIGIVVAAVMMNFNVQGPSGNEQPDTSDEVVEEEDEIEVGEPVVEIEQTGTAEVENGSFSIKDQSGAVIAEDDVMGDITGIKSCETVNSDVDTSIRCIVTTEEGEGIYVYYPEDKALKYADQ